MSGPIEVTLQQEILFIKRLLIPSFDEDHGLATNAQRKVWMKQRAVETHWDANLASELIIMYGMVGTLEKAEQKLQESMSALAQESTDKMGSAITAIHQKLEENHKLLEELYVVQGDDALLEALSTDSDRQFNHEEFENKIVLNYGCINTHRHPHQLRCMVTNQFHDARLVCKGAHLLALSEKRSMRLLGLQKCDVWDPRNGLCILRTIDKRFESKELVYMPVAGHPDAYRVKILYDDLLSQPLNITVGELNGTTETEPATFMDIEGRDLTFTTHFRPYKRVLLFIAYSAFNEALANTRRAHTLASAAAPAGVEAWRELFSESTAAGSPPLPATGFIMQKFLNVK